MTEDGDRGEGKVRIDSSDNGEKDVKRRQRHDDNTKHDACIREEKLVPSHIYTVAIRHYRER